jgi:hypothetical protein
MPSSVRHWIDSDQVPADFYELLGLARFHADSREIDRAIRTAMREIMLLQNHRDPKICERAILLQRELGRVEETFAKPAKRDAYNGQLVELLRQAYLALVRTKREISIAELQEWLLCEQNVHSSQVAAIAAAICPPLDATTGETARQDDGRWGTALVAGSAESGSVVEQPAAEHRCRWRDRPPNAGVHSGRPTSRGRGTRKSTLDDSVGSLFALAVAAFVILTAAAFVYQFVRAILWGN